MSDADASKRGPAVDASENLLRFITTPSFWVLAEKRPSSAAFDKPKFSVNIESLASFAEHQRQLSDTLQRPNGGIIRFTCRTARDLSFQAHAEIDAQYPDNAAHAHVYDDGDNQTRKRRARSLAMQCSLVVTPQFHESSTCN